MRIAFISLMSGLPWGGSEVLWSKTAKLALSQGHEVFISVYDWGNLHPEIQNLKNNGAKVCLRQRFKNEGDIFYKSFLYFKNRIKFLNRNYKPLINFCPDHVLINQGDMFDISVHHYSLYELIKKKNIPFTLICHSHNQYSEIPEENVYPKAKEIFERAVSIFFVSKRMQNIAERKLCTKLSNVNFTWNPLNLKKTDYIFYPNETTFQFAIVGNLLSGKGHDTLFECLSQLHWQKRNWHLNIYGKGLGKKYLKDLANFFSINEKITFHGYVSNIEDIWKSNHILLIPSAGEGLPISLIEAMFCGRPAVVTDVGGNAEVITEDITGFIAEGPTVSSYSNALEKAWENREKWELMGLNAHNFCIKNIDLECEKTLLNYIMKS